MNYQRTASKTVAPVQNTIYVFNWVNLFLSKVTENTFGPSSSNKQAKDNASPGSLRGRGQPVWQRSALPPSPSPHLRLCAASYPTLPLVHKPKSYWIEAKDVKISWRYTLRNSKIKLLHLTIVQPCLCQTDQNNCQSASVYARTLLADNGQSEKTGTG